MTRLPHESLVYVGDTARVPYGPKSPDTVQRYALQIAEWLVGQGVKLIVVACNTATAHALPALRGALTVPVVGVIEPGARAAASRSGSGRVGVIGTAGTIASGAYARAISNVAPDLEVIGQPCPLFVPLVEEGWIEHPATRLVVHEYLAPLHDQHVTSVVLGCTHYPLLRDIIAQELGDGVTLVDSAEETARDVEHTLRERSLLADGHATARYRFVASDAPQHFLALGSRFLGRSLEQVEHVVFT